MKTGDDFQINSTYQPNIMNEFTPQNLSTYRKSMPNLYESSFRKDSYEIQENQENLYNKNKDIYNFNFHEQNFNQDNKIKLENGSLLNASQQQSCDENFSQKSKN